MPAHQQLSFDSLAATGATEEACHATPATETMCAPVLRYSSPWPWILALAISSTMWVGIGWLVWTIV
ncbi:hypothetical protein [Bradyrhizobium sp.]|uniref:hypothetical protein n=1 Tax=Bradyrhizobium sp. TaxID=376 RepID=UPI003C53B7EE